MVKCTGTDDPRAVDHFVTPQMGVAVQDNVELPGNRHHPKEITAMPVGKPQTHSVDLQPPPKAVTSMPMASHRPLEGAPIPVAITENPVDLEVGQDFDGIGAGDVPAVDQGLDPSVGQSPRRPLQPIEAVMAVRENSDHYDAANTIVPSLVSPRITALTPRPHPRVRQRSWESAVPTPSLRSR